MKKSAKIFVLFLLAMSLLLLAACKNDIPLTPGGSGSSKGDSQSSQTPKEESSQAQLPEKLVVGTNVGLSDIETVSLSKVGEGLQEFYGFAKTEEGYLFKADYYDGTAHVVEAFITAEEWNSMLSLINGTILYFPGPEEDPYVTDQEETFLYITWRGQKEADRDRQGSMDDEKEERLIDAFRELSQAYELPTLGQNMQIADLSTFTFSAGRIATHVSFVVSFEAPGRTLDYTYSGEGLMPEGTADMYISGHFPLRQEELAALFELLKDHSVHEEPGTQEEAYEGLIQARGSGKTYYVDLTMADAELIVAWFQQMKVSHTDVTIPDRAILDQYHGVSLMAALDGVKRVELVSTWGAPDSGIQATDADIWYLSEEKQIEVYYSQTNGQLYDIFITER